MAIQGLLYKAYGGQGATALIPTSYAGKINKVQYVTDSGKVYSTKMQTAGSSETGAYKFNFGTSPEQLGPGKVQLILDDGTTLEQPITTSTNDFRNGQETAPQNANSGPGGVGGVGANGAPASGGFPSQFMPGSVGYGSVPAYLGKEYPSPVLTGFNPISPTRSNTAPYNFTDPQAYAAKFGDFNRGEALKNFNLSTDMSLKALSTELTGLTGFVPAASALKRSETSLDNVFNQQQRTTQVDSALPGVRQDLTDQAARARTYASGGVPNAVLDRSLDISTRSGAADAAYSGGVGANSVAARNASDLMSAKDRIALSQYGDQLLTGNINTKSSLLLAPTEYSNAGSQISVMPKTDVGNSSLTEANNLNTFTGVSSTNALTSNTQQNQYTSSQEQQTRLSNATFGFNTKTYNATTGLQNSQFNATNMNNFAQGKFQYDVSYAGAVAGAAQTNTNTQLGLQQQAQSAAIFQQMLAAAQKTQQTGAITQGIAAILPQLAGIIGSIGNLFQTTSGGGAASTVTPTSSNIATTGVTPPFDASPPSTGTSFTIDSGTPTTGVDGSAFGGPEGSSYIPNGTPIPDGYYPLSSTGAGTIVVPDVSSVDTFFNDSNFVYQ